jgi:rare lipoprotein A
MLTRRLSIVFIVALLSATGVAYPQSEEGLASWYGGKFHGRLTANGETFDTNELTAAHKTLPFGTLVKVTHVGDGRSVVVRINDRGPFVEGRIIDLSRAAADAIGLTARGIAPVHIEVVHAVQPVAFRTIQVGSFSVRANAEALRERLEAAGFSPILESSTARRHRVLIQHVPLGQIDTYRGRLAEIGLPDVLVREP